MYNGGVKPRQLPFLAIFLSALFWCIDAMIDILIFEEEGSAFENIFKPEPVELWMRSFVVLLMIGFSFYARYLLKVQIKISAKLIKYKNKLETIVSLRTKELENKNKELEDEILMRKKIEKTLEKIVELNSD